MSALALQVAGVVLIGIGSLAAFLFLVALLDGQSILGGIVFIVAALLVAAAGAWLRRVGLRRSPVTLGEWALLHARALLHLFFGLLALGSGTAAVLLLAHGAGVESGVGVFLASVPFFIAMMVFVEVGVRGGGPRAQWLVVGAGLLAAAVVLLVIGVTAQDARQLVQYAVVCTIAAAGAGAGAGTARGARTDRPRSLSEEGANASSPPGQEGRTRGEHRDLGRGEVRDEAPVIAEGPEGRPRS